MDKTAEGSRIEVRYFGLRRCNLSLEEDKDNVNVVRVSIPVEAGNAAAKDGTLAITIEKILVDLKA